MSRYNQSALAITANALNNKISQSDTLQRHSDTYPFLKETFSKLFELKKSFNYLTLIWTKGHNSSSNNNIFTIFNTQCDSLCTSLINQQERLLSRSNMRIN